MNKIRSDFLIATPSFVSGASRLLDWYGLYDSYNSSATELEADYKALRADWCMVGQDIFGAMKQFEKVYLPCLLADRSDENAGVASHRR